MIERYGQDGYVLERQRIPVELVEAARADAYRMHSEAGGRFGTYGVYDHPDGTQWHRKHVHHLPAVAAILPHLPVCELLGNETCGITHSKFSYKAAGKVQPWCPHQDAAYKHEARRGVTFAVPLETVGPENGTLEILPGSHRFGILPHVVAYPLGIAQQPQVEAQEMPHGDFVPIEATQGDVVALSLLTVHRSGPNRSQGLRAILFVEVEPYTDRLYDDMGGPVTLIATKETP